MSVLITNVDGDKQGQLRERNASAGLPSLSFWVWDFQVHVIILNFHFINVAR